MPKPFCHLHNHSEFSLLDGASKIKEMIKHAVDLDMPGIGLTDHGTMYGSLEFYQEAKKAGIKGIVGVELYVSPRHRSQKEADLDRKSYHLVALAKNETGYKNLMKLATIASLEGMYYKPRVDRESLAQYSEGLIICSACMGGELASAIRENPEALNTAADVAAWHREVWGDDFYLEVQGHGAEGQWELNHSIKRLSQRMGIKMVATNDSHYLKASDAQAHDVLVCIQTGTDIHNPARMRYEPREFYVKSYDEMWGAFEGFAPDAIENTMEVFEKVNLDIALGRAPMPSVGLLPGMNADDTVAAMCREGLARRMPNHSREHADRLEYELGVIKDMGFSQYFLIVSDMTNHAKEKGIEYGPRGSAAGALTAYCLGISDIDPLKYNLTFERFLNPERVSMPDIDMDFQDDRRAEVIEHLTKTYGSDCVANITTFAKMGARAAIGDAGRALGLPKSEVSHIASMVPKIPLSITIKKAMEGWPEKQYDGNPEMKKEYQTNPMVRRLLDTAMSIEGISKSQSVHAAGIVVSDRPLTEYTPLRIGKNKDFKEVIVTQYPHASLEEAGLLKLDVLGLINLTVISRALKLIEPEYGKMDRWDFPIDIENEQAAGAYALLGRAQTTGVFQLEGVGMRKYLKELKPQSIEEISAMVALYRPGPMKHIPRYIRGKFDPSSITYLHPLLEPILRTTYGVITYQDQVLDICRAVAGMTRGQADLLRRAMGKKKQSEMDAQKVVFMEGAKNNGVPSNIAEQIFTDIEPFAGYAFNGAHAACYAFIAYQTAFLKANYPAEYMAAMLSAFAEKNNEGGDAKVRGGIAECAQLGIEVLPPDVNKSGVDFKAEYRVQGGRMRPLVRFGLAAVAGIGGVRAQAIVDARETGGEFTSMSDLCGRIAAAGVSVITTPDSLSLVGALDSVEAQAPSMHERRKYVEQHWKAREGGEDLVVDGWVSEPARSVEEWLRGEADRPRLTVTVDERDAQRAEYLLESLLHYQGQGEAVYVVCRDGASETTVRLPGRYDRALVSEHFAGMPCPVALS